MRNTGNSVQIDRLGLRILQRLAIDGRTSYSDLGRELKLSVNTVRDRILAMERRGLIQGYRAVLDERRAGNNVHAMVFMQTKANAGPIDALAARAQKAIRQVHRATGRHSLVLEMAAPDMSELQSILQEELFDAGYAVDRILLLGERLDRIHQRKEAA